MSGYDKHASLYQISEQCMQYAAAGKGVTLQQVEQTLALFNEYLVHVSAHPALHEPTAL